MIKLTSAEQYRELVERSIDKDQHRLCWLQGSTSVWMQILNDYPEFKSFVVLNKCLPTDVLLILARDSDPSVRFTIATKRSLPESVFLMLAKDDDESVRHRVAVNPKTPTYIRKMLVNDLSKFVFEAAISKLETAKD